MNSKLPRGKVKNKEEAILNAALTAITQHGFQGANIKRIADQAEIATGTVYLYFPNKDAIVHALFQQIGAQINAQITLIITQHTSVELQFKEMMRSILGLYTNDPRLAEFITLYLYSPYAKSTHGHPKTFLQPVDQFFTQAIRAKHIKKLDITALIALSHGPITAYVRMAQYTKVSFHSSKLNAFIQASWDAIKV